MKAFATFALAAVATVSVIAQQRPPVEQPPTFRGSVELVEVDVYVTDADGKPVRGLTADDFDVFEDGQRRVINTFAAVDIPVVARETAWRDAEPDVATNTKGEGRVYLIILDASVPAGVALRARHQLHRFIEEDFGDNDLAAIVGGRGLRTDGQDFTNNRRLLLAAIDKFSGGGTVFSSGGGSALEGDPYFRDFRERMELFARMPGGRKAVLWLTEAVYFKPHDIIDYQGGVPSLMQENAHAAMAAATRANIRVYPISPSGLTDMGDLDSRDPVAELDKRIDFRGVAELTGGFAVANSNDFAGAFERLVRETGTYYVLGFESSARPKQGRYVRFEVKAKRPDLKVNARPGYVEQLQYVRKTMKKEPERSPVAAALANPVAVAGLPMRVNATAYREAKGSDADVALTIELDASALSFVEENGQFRAKLEIRHLATDARNVLHPEYRHSTEFTVKGDDYQRLLDGAVRVVTQIELPKGRHQIRVASVSGDKTGSVLYDLDIPDLRDGPLTMSGVSIAVTPAAGVTLQGDSRGGKPRGCRPPTCTADVRSGLVLTPWSQGTKQPLPWQDALPAPPTTDRIFTADETVTAFLEVYDNNPKAGKPPDYQIDLTATLRGEDDTVVRTVSEQRESREPRRSSGGHGFTVSMPLRGIAPGAYLLQFEARSGSNAEAAVSRRIPIRVRE
jgi:VWFA-related protein